MKFRSEHGFVITIYVLVIVLVILFVMIGKLILADKDLKSHVASLENLKEDCESEIGEYYDYKVEDNNNDYEVYYDDIPIYNSEDFLYFSDYMEENESPKYYIYQEEAFYVGGKRKNYILMSDIYLDEYEEELLNTNKLINSINFNNHVVFLKDTALQD